MEKPNQIPKTRDSVAGQDSEIESVPHPQGNSRDLQPFKEL